MSDFWKTACLLMLPLVFAHDLPISPTHVLEQTDSCPEAGYYYRAADPGCFLCFCQNSSAACWRRESGCDGQIHQIRELPSGDRVRRSPLGLSDIFFRDATREFFKKQLPEQCKPHEGSFSDGCPPADWCVGCTVCDCDANGRWDCHILSFCNDEEKKKKKKVPLPKSMPTRRVYHKKSVTPKNHVTLKPKKVVKKSIPKPLKAQSRSLNNGRQNNNVKKIAKNNKKPSNNNNRPNNVKKPNNKERKPNNNKRLTNNNKKPNKPRPNQKKTQSTVRPKHKPKSTTRKPHTKRYMVKKKQNKTAVTTTELPKTTESKKKILRKRVTSTSKPADDIFDEEDIKKHIESKGSPESVLGRKIVSKMMGTVQRMLGKQMEKLQNRSRVERSIDEKNNCMKNNKIHKKAWKLNDYMLRKNKLKHRKMPQHDINSVRRKREAIDLDLSVLDLNDANLINDSFDLSVKRITKMTEFDDSNTNSNDLNKTYTDQNELKINGSNTNDLNNYLRKISSNPSDFIINVSSTNDSNTFHSNAKKLNSTDSNIDLRDNVMNSATSTLLTDKIASTNELISITAGTQYYEYSIDRNSSTASTNSVITELRTTIIASNENNTTLNPLITYKTDKMKYITERSTKKTKELILFSKKPEFNDLKHKKWERMKIFRDSTIQINQISKFNKDNREFNAYTIDNPLIKRLRNKKNRENITRRFGVTNKHNLKKIVMNNFNTDELTTDSYITTWTPTDSSHNISKLPVLLRNLVKEINNNTTSTSKLRTKFSLFKYLRNIFENIFYRKKGKHFMGHKTNEAMTLQILCENIGACYLNKHNRIALRNKIHDLNAETEKIFKTIKIIKGLLYLIVLPVIKDNSTTTKPPKDEIQKLDAILRGNYEENSNLTQTQASQINYVKENIQQFVESVGKFATTLNEILNVLYKNNKKYSCQRNLRYFSKKKKLNALNQIKDLLVKYNIIQNTFMKNMYKLLTEIEKNTTTEKPKPKVSDRDLNNTQVIDRYSKNIIQNLRKLKELARALSSSRKKRQTKRDDDAIEYLLMLMEYLLKQNHPLDTAPVNDGIDLLIEAIQNAPHIKPIKKKVLDELPTTQRATRTTSNLRYFNEYSNSNSNVISKEDNSISRNEKSLVVDESVNYDEETTQGVYYKRFDDYDNSSDLFITTEYTKNISDEAKFKTGENTGIDRFESAVDYTKRYEVFYSDLEDEPILPVVINATNVLELTTIQPQNEQATHIHDYKLDEDPVRLSKSKLDWFEESFDKEIKEYREENISNITLSSNTTEPATTTKPVVKSVDNISSITVEVEDEKKKIKEASDEVMHRKQIEFLNSLDYGTEKSELDDSDLKDDEKFSGDFPSYFVK